MKCRQFPILVLFLLPCVLIPQTIGNGDFEQDYAIGWTTGGRLQGTDVVERVTDGDADGDYEIRLYHYDYTEIDLSQTITVAALDVTLSFDAKLRGWSTSDTQNWWGAGAIDISYLNGNDSVLAIYRMGDITLGYGQADTPSLYTNYISDEIWHSYSINLLDEYNLHFSGFQTSDVTQIKIRLWAYGSYWGGTGVGGEVFADDFIITSSETELLAYYPFNGNANDESSNSFDGTVTGATLTADRFGNANSAYYLDGNDYITTGLTTEVGTTFSYTGWGKALDATNSMFIERDSYWDGPNRMNMTYLSDSIFVFGMVDTDDTWPLGGVSGRYSRSPDTLWHHIAVSINDATKQMIGYFDGVPVDTVTFTASQVNTAGRTWKLGKRDNVGQYFKGYIDDVRFYTRILSATEIDSLYHEGGWAVPSPNWDLQIQSSQGGYTDNDNYLGVASDATDGFDSDYEVVEPPAAPGGSISTYFPHPEWANPLGDNFSKDIKSEIVLTDTMQVWNFDVTTTDAGSVTLTFNFTDIPGLPVIFEDTTANHHEQLTNGSTYTFTSTASSTRSFTIAVGDTTAPSLTLNNNSTGPMILLSDSTHTFAWSSSDGYEVDSLELWFSTDSGATYSDIGNFNDGTLTSLDWVVPTVSLIPNGILKVRSTDYAGNYTEKTSDHVITLAGDSLASPITAGWTLWGVPMTPYNDSTAYTVDDDISGYWVIYDYRNGGYTYDGQLDLTRGYWLGSLSASTIDAQGTPSDTGVSAALSQGWELMSNPLVVDVDVDSLLFTQNDVTETYADAVTAGWVNSIYGYDGNGYVIPTTLEPWSGYWMGVLQTGVSITFPIHHQTAGAQQSPSLATVEDASNWRISFGSMAGSAQDNTTKIGVDSDGSDVFDPNLDLVKAPNPPGPEFVSLSILHPEWGSLLGDRFSTDFRSEIQEGEKTWQLSLESSETQVELTWLIIGLPEGINLNLTVDDQNTDMIAQSSIALSGNTDFTVTASVQVLGLTDQSIVPEEFALHQNYPNPFNPSSTIQYDLPEAADVTLIVYDILGREVVKLVDQQMQRGYHRAIWDARDHSGRTMPTGIYIARLITPEYSKSIKMLLLK